MASISPATSSSSDDEDTAFFRRAKANLGVLPTIQVPTADDSDDDSSSVSSGGAEGMELVFSSFAVRQATHSPTSFTAQPASPVPSSTAPSAPPALSPGKAGTDPARPAVHQDLAPVTSDSRHSAAEVTPCSPGLDPNTSDTLVTSPREGPSWLTGAAGRLSDLSSPRSRELITTEMGLDAAGHTTATAAELEALEGALDRQFHESLETDTQQVLPAANCGLALEDDVMGVAMSDLDSLIARLQAGASWDLNATRPSYLPDPSTLFSDSEDDEPHLPQPPNTTAQHARQAQRSQPPGLQQPAYQAQRVPTAHAQQQAVQQAQKPPGLAPAAQLALPAGTAAVLDTMLGALGTSSNKLPQAGSGSSSGSKQPLVSSSAVDTMLSELVSDAMEPDMGAAGVAAARAEAKAMKAKPPAMPVPSTLPPRFRALAQPASNTAPPIMPPRFRAWPSGPPPAVGAAPSPLGTEDSNEDDAPKRPTVVVDLRASIATSLKTNHSHTMAAKPSAQAASTAATAPGQLTRAADSARPSSEEATAPARKSMFVSTKDMPSTAAPTTEKRSMFVSTRDLPSTAAPTAEKRSMFVSTKAMPQLTQHPAFNPPSQLQPHPPSEQPLQTRPSRPAPARQAAPAASQTQGSAAPGTPAAVRQQVSEEVGTVAPDMVTVSLDTEDDWRPVPGTASAGVTRHTTPAGAPGKPLEKGAVLVKAGARIKLPPGPVAEPPRPQQAEPMSTQTEEVVGSQPVEEPQQRQESQSVEGVQQVEVVGVAVVDLRNSAGGDEPKSNNVPEAHTRQPPLGAHQVPARAAPALEQAPARAAPAQEQRSTQTATFHAQDRPSLQAALQAPAAPSPAAEPLRLPRLPPAVVSAQCVTLMLATHASVNTCELATLWQAVFGSLPSTTVSSLPCLQASTKSSRLPGSLSVVSASLVQYPMEAVQVAGLQQAMVQADIAGRRARKADSVRVLLVVCRPGGDAGQACGAVRQWLGVGEGWSRLTVDSGAGEGLCCWCACQPTADVVDAPSRQPLSLPAASNKRRSSTSGSTGRSQAVGRHSDSGRASNSGTGSSTHRVSMGGDGESQGDSTFVVSLPQGALQCPQSLATVLQHAAALGLTVQGMTCTYPTASTAHYLSTRTPHRCEAGQPLLLLALHGASGALARWRACQGASDPKVAARAEPTSLHGMLARCLPATALHTATTACSTSIDSAAAELELFFPLHTGPSQQPGAPGADCSAGMESPQLLSAPPVTTSRWLAFPAVTTGDCIQALWALQHLAWSGACISACLRTTRPASLAAFRMSQLGAATSMGVGAATGELVSRPMPDVVLVAEVRGVESQEQLTLMLQRVPAQVPQAGGKAAGPATGLWVYGCTPNQARCLEVAEQRQVSAMPGADEAADALDAAVAQRGLETDAISGVDQLVVVFVQSTSLQAVLLLAASMAANAAAPVVAGPDSVDGSRVAGTQVVRCAPSRPAEVVACRVVKSLPLDCARRLHPAGPGISNKGTSGPQARLHASHPGVLLVLHGANAAQLPSSVLSTWRAGHALERNQDAGPAASEEPSPMESLYGRLGVSQCKEGSPVPGVFVSQSLSDARTVLATCFKDGTQVMLDPTFHDGVHRPGLSASGTPPSSTQTAAGSALGHLLTCPHDQETCLVLLLAPGTSGDKDTLDAPKTASTMTCIHRTFRVLQKEHFTVTAATMVQLSEQLAATCMNQAQLGGQCVLLLRLRRSNALLHLQQVLHRAGLDGRCVIPAPSWTAAQELLAAIAQSGVANTGLDTASRPCHPSVQQLAQQAGRQQRCAAPSMLQTACVVLLPATGSVTEGAGPLDWGAAGDVVSSLQGDGFQLLGVQGCRLRPALVSVTSKACGLSTQVVSRLNAWSHHSTPPNDVKAHRQQATAGAMEEPTACGALVLLLQRTNAVAELQLCMQQYTQAQSSNGEPGRLHVCVTISSSAAGDVWHCSGS